MSPMNESRAIATLPTPIRLGLVALVSAFAWGCGSDAEPGTDMGDGMEMDMGEGGMGEMDHSQHMMGASTDRQMVHLTRQQEQALGVRYVTVGRRHLERTIRTVGRIVASEARIADVTPKVDGFVETLSVNTTGETVRAGQPLLTIYSPDLLAAQEELVIARRLVERVGDESAEAAENARSMLESARRRLRYWDITEEQIRRLEEEGEVTKALTLVSPVDGVVVQKSVNQGQRIMPGTMLYRIADLSEVWVEGEVFERDLALIEDDAEAHIEVSAFPGQHFMGRVDFVYPVMDVASRTNRVRVAMPNPAGALKPGMFATMFFDVMLDMDQVAVPLEAVIHTGERNLVFVHEQDMLTPREVVLGPQAGEWVQILAGLDAGEEIVGAANFLVDAESRLGTTGGMMPGMQHGAMEPMQPDSAAAAGGHVHD
jgi:Cu(I)/Ag(I) efflux system membrane fusion protein